MENILEIIVERRSVRTFAKEAVDAQKLDELKTYAENLSNPWNIPVEFVFMDQNNINSLRPY